MKDNTITVVYHSGKEDLREIMTKLVMIKISSEEKLRKDYRDNIHATTILTGK